MNSKAYKNIYINARFLTQAITGVQRVAHELVKALDILIEKGEIDTSRYRIELLAPKSGKIHDLQLKNISVHRVGNLSGHAWEQFELPFYSRSGLLVCPGNTAPIFSLISGQKTIVTVHDLSYLYFPEAYSFAFRAFYSIVIPMVLKYSSRVITVSESERISILQYYKHAEKRLKVVHNGGLPGEYLDKVDTIKAAEISDKPFVLYVGSLSRRKNLQGVIEAIAILNRNDEIPAVIVGAGGKSFRNTRFGIPEDAESSIDFKGQINDIGDIVGLYKSAACFVFPSFYESSGLPPIEAMACGCPVVVSPIPALVERCGDAALYANPDDSTDIADKINKVIKDSALAEDLRNKGFERAKIFTWEICARQTWEIINDVLSD